MVAIGHAKIELGVGDRAGGEILDEDVDGIDQAANDLRVGGESDRDLGQEDAAVDAGGTGDRPNRIGRVRALVVGVDVRDVGNRQEGRTIDGDCGYRFSGH